MTWEEKIVHIKEEEEEGDLLEGDSDVAPPPETERTVAPTALIGEEKKNIGGNDRGPRPRVQLPPPLEEDNGRERLKRHRSEVAGRVWVPDMWGQEDFFKDWVDCSAFDASLLSSKIMAARGALLEESRMNMNVNAAAGGLRIENRC